MDQEDDEEEVEEGFEGDGNEVNENDEEFIGDHKRKKTSFGDNQSKQKRI
jgi:hypothetical protein